VGDRVFGLVGGSEAHVRKWFNHSYLREEQISAYD
jgi:hypothetical protein